MTARRALIALTLLSILTAMLRSHTHSVPILRATPYRGFLRE